MLGCLEAAVPLAASPLLTVIYNTSLETFPGSVYIAEAAAMFIALILFATVSCLMKPDRSNFQTLDNEI